MTARDGEIVNHIIKVVAKKLQECGIQHYPPSGPGNPLTVEDDYIEYRVLPNASLFLYIPMVLNTERPEYVARLLERYKKYLRLAIKLAKPVNLDEK